MNSPDDKPLVSIIMPTYNSSGTVCESINSALNQTYENWELLITDDCSTDNTVQLIGSFNDHRINLFSLKSNSGAGVARNNSIKNAKGRYIAFLDSDDLWLPNKLTTQISFMQQKKIYFSYSGYTKFDKRGTRGNVTPPKSISYNELLFGNVIGCLTAIYDTEKFGKRYMPEIRKRQDMSLWLELLKECNRAYSTQSILALYRSDSGMTSNKLNIAIHQWKFYRAHLKLKFMKTLFIFSIYSINGLLKSINF